MDLSKSQCSMKTQRMYTHNLRSLQECGNAIAVDDLTVGNAFKEARLFSSAMIKDVKTGGGGGMGV